MYKNYHPHALLAANRFGITSTHSAGLLYLPFFFLPFPPAAHSAMTRKLTLLRSKIPPLSELLSRAQQVGGLSLFALLIGGSILILFSMNIIASDEVYRAGGGGSLNGATMVVFKFGSQLGVQTWLAVLGVAFGLLSFGMNGSFTHLFDSWSSYRATRAPGLNYARYLNSQPQSPVFFGIRGFPWAILLRNVVIGLGIVASAGYSFAVVDVAVDTYQHLDQELIRLRFLPSEGLLEGGTTSPWFGDAPLSSRNRAFTHQLESRYRGKPGEFGTHQIPKRIVMAGWADCGDTFNGLDKGVLYTREVVLVARKTQDTERPEIFMASDHPGWVRVENSSFRWTGNNGSVGTGEDRAVVDYRTPKSGRIETQWAKAGAWARVSSDKQPVIRKVTFNVRLGVAIVRRLVSGKDCAEIFDEDGVSLSAQIVTTSTMSFLVDNYQEATNLNRNWINPIVISQNAGPREGVSGLVRAVMSTWAASSFIQGGGSVSSYLGHAPASMPVLPQVPNNSNSSADSLSHWLNEKAYNGSTMNTPSSPIFDFPEILNNNATHAARSHNLSTEYPVYAGTRSTGQTGSYHSISYLFISFGVFAYLLISARMYLGPAELTSWMGQHVYLAGLGAKIPKEATDHLASGHQAAIGSELGRIRVKDNEPLPMPRYWYWLHVHDVSSDNKQHWRWVND